MDHSIIVCCEMKHKNDLVNPWRVPVMLHNKFDFKNIFPCEHFFAFCWPDGTQSARQKEKFPLTLHTHYCWTLWISVSNFFHFFPRPLHSEIAFIITLHSFHCPSADSCSINILQWFSDVNFLRRRPGCESSRLSTQTSRKWKTQTKNLKNSRIVLP